MRFASSAIALVFLTGCISLADRDNPLDPAYTGPRGEVAGKVVLRSGNALHLDDDGKVKLDYSGVEVGFEEFPAAATVTNTAGDFSLARVPVGEWTLKVSLAGYVTATVRDVQVKAQEVGAVAPINLEEIIAGNLVFGSSRTGFPTLFQSNPYGGDIRGLSALPLQSNRCYYASFQDREVLVVDTDLAVYEENGAFLSESGLFIGSFPELSKIAVLPKSGKLTSILLHPDGDLVMQAEEDGDVFIIKAPLVRLLRGESAGEFRVTGAAGDEWEEMHPAVSPSGKIAYVRASLGAGEATGYEIRVHDGSEEGKLIYQRPLLAMLKALSKQGFFDFDSDGHDDLEKFGTLLNYLDSPVPLLAGVDWSAPIDPENAAAFLEGPEPDGIDLNPTLLLIELIQLGEIWNLAWLPDESALIFTDRLLSQPGYSRRVLWPIYNYGAPVSAAGVYYRDPVNGRTTNYFHDIYGKNGTWEPGYDRPFWFENRASYIENVTIDLQRVELQAINRVGIDRSHEIEEIDRFFFADANHWIFSPSVSPDGKRVAVSVGAVEHIAEAFSLFPIMTAGNILTIDPVNGFVTRITTDGLNNRAPCWVP